MAVVGGGQSPNAFESGQQDLLMDWMCDVKEESRVMPIVFAEELEG